MTSNLDKYRKDLEALITEGENLYMAMQYECLPGEFEKALVDKTKNQAKARALIADLPSFRENYQHWYSAALAVLKQLLPDRLTDFIRHYEVPKGRKEVTHSTYVVADYLRGLIVTLGVRTVVGPQAALTQFEQQLSILKSVLARFESSLFEIRQLVQADIFDSELDAARELLKNKFGRAAGAMAGVVLEKHLAQVCANHSITVTKKDPTIGDLNDLLKSAGVLDVPQWRFIQHLGDIRNLCDHNKKVEPTAEQVNDLLAGVDKLIKTLY